MEDCPDRNTTRYVTAQCECGTVKEVKLFDIIRGRSLSCGCLQREVLLASPPRRRHGMSGTRIHGIWKGIFERCKDKETKNCARYGARGIRIDPRWSSFENFYADMGESYERAVQEVGEKQVSIERVDNNGPYSPKNCTWATRRQQCINRSMARRITFNGKTQNLCLWADETGLSPDTIYARLKLGWSVERTLTEKARSGRRWKLPK